MRTQNEENICERTLTYLVGCDELLVLPHGLPLEGAVEDADGLHGEAWPDLHEAAVHLLRGRLLLLHDLVVAEGYPTLHVEEAEHVVHEGLAVGVVTRGPERLCQQRTQHLKLRLHRERIVEGKHRTRSTQAVTRHLELIHCVQIAHKELRARAVRDLRNPHVQILPLAVLEEDSGVAALELAELGDGFGEALLLVKLGLRLVVRHELSDVHEEVALLA